MRTVSLVVALVALLFPARAVAQNPPRTPDLVVTMIDAPDPVGPGRTLTYRIGVGVRGARAASNVAVRTAVPGGTTFAALDGPSDGWTYDAPEPGGTGDVAATAASLAPGRMAVFQLSVVVADDAADGSTIPNSVTVSQSDADPTPDDDTAATSTTVREAPPLTADLSIRIEYLQEFVPSLGQIVALLTVRNDGPMTATNLGVGTRTPDGAVFVSASSSHGPVTGPDPGGTGDVLTQIDALPSGELATVAVVLRVTAPERARIEQTAMVAAASGDPDMSNNTDRAMAVVVPQGPAADVSVAFAAAPQQIFANADLSYDVTVADAGPVPAEDVTVLVPIPRGARFLSADSDAGMTRTPPLGSSGAVGWRPGSLAPGASATLTVTVRVGARPGAPFVTTALVTSRAADPDLTDNAALAATRIQSLGDAVIQWSPPDLSSGADAPPPSDVVVDANADGAAKRSDPTTGVARDDAQEVVSYNVYVSSTPDVATTPENLFTTVPANQTTTTAPVEPGGSFFTVTATYGTGESDAANTAGTGDATGATLSSMKVSSGKVVAKGSGFTDVVEVLVDGIPFADAAKVKGGKTKVVQTGSLSIGTTLDEYLSTGSQFLFVVRNSDGGVSTYTYAP